MAITDGELDAIVGVTSRFETSGDPYQGVSGDFDGQGISCGVLQWNIGQLSLQPLVRGAGEAAVLAAMPQHGRELWRACNAPLGEALGVVRSWQQGTKLRPQPLQELRALMGSPALRGQQNAAIRKVAEKAETLADAWAMDRGSPRRSLRDLAWFFDVVTQNGSMKGLGFADVAGFRQAAAPGRADDLVCDWLAATDDGFAGKVDCHKNGRLWRDRVEGDALDLLILSYLRSQKSTLRWRGDVLNRKGSIAVGSGWVHRSLRDFGDILGTA